MPAPPFDISQAQRWFAIELNNQAWDLVEAGSRTTDQTERMIHAAHAACLHWLEAGDLLNHLRAQNLLATVYVAAGYVDAAVRHAEKCLSLSEQAAGQQNTFDRACVHGCACAAYSLAQDSVKAAEHAEQLTAACSELDEEEKNVVNSLYASA